MKSLEVLHKTQYRDGSNPCKNILLQDVACLDIFTVKNSGKCFQRSTPCLDIVLLEDMHSNCRSNVKWDGRLGLVTNNPTKCM